MKTVLIRPPEINRVWVGIPKFFNDGIFLFPPLGIMQLKGYIEKHTPYKVIIYDSLVHRADYDKIARFIRKISPQVVGISTFTHSLVDVVNTAGVVKKIDPFIHVTIGGPHTYAFSNESAHLLNLGCIDSVVLGDGEIAFKEMLCALDKSQEFSGINGIIYRNQNGEIIRNGEPVFISHLDTLPFPSRDIYGFKRYYTPASSGNLMTTIITSRGCPYNCKFCNVQKKYRSRSIENVVDEIQTCIKLGFKEIFFVDDTFNVSTERVIRFSEEILRRKLKIKWGFKARCDNVTKEMLAIAKKSGCFRIHYGVETGLMSGLSAINKKVTLDIIKSAFGETKKYGIRTTAYFMLGCPYERNFSDIRETIDFAVNLKTDFAVFSLLSPYPDTIFYREGIEKGILNPRPWDAFIRNPDGKRELPTCWDEYFTKKDLIRFLKIAHRKFYYRPAAVRNILFDIHSFKELFRLLKGALSLFKLEFFNSSNGTL